MMPRLTANGIEIEYETRGADDAPPLLLIMGLGMPAAMWPDAFVDAFVAQGYRVVTFDNRDSGGSTRLSGTRIPNVAGAIARALLRRKVRSPYTLDDMAADTAGLLDVSAQACASPTAPGRRTGITGGRNMLQ